MADNRGWRETRGAMRTRLAGDGRLEAYEARKKDLVANEGMAKSEAMVQCDTEFGRRDGLVQDNRKLYKPPVGVPSNPQPMHSMSAADRKVVEAKDPVSERKSLRWVYQSVGLDVGPVEAPNTGAWSYLQWVRSSDQARTEFYAKVVPRLMASKLEDGSEDYGDDGGPVTQMINRLLEATGAKRLDSEGRSEADGRTS